MTQKYIIVHYMDDGKDIFQDWLKSLKDILAKKAIQKAVDRMEDGN